MRVHQMSGPYIPCFCVWYIIYCYSFFESLLYAICELCWHNGIVKITEIITTILMEIFALFLKWIVLYYFSINDDECRLRVELLSDISTHEFASEIDVNHSIYSRGVFLVHYNVGIIKQRWFLSDGNNFGDEVSIYNTACEYNSSRKLHT